jgi:hypothetical protein
MIHVYVPLILLQLMARTEWNYYSRLSELPSITPLVIAWLAMQVVVDTFITGKLLWAYMDEHFTYNYVRHLDHHPHPLTDRFS